MTCDWRLTREMSTKLQAHSQLIFLISVALTYYSYAPLQSGSLLTTLPLDTVESTMSTDTLLAKSNITQDKDKLSDVLWRDGDLSKEHLTSRSPKNIASDRHLNTIFTLKQGIAWFIRYPSSSVALICSIVPGGGQTYNRRYWKVPIVLSAITAGIYAISWNQRLYNEYHTAYADLLSDNPLDHTSWQSFIPPGGNPADYVSDGNLRSRLEKGSKQYKENRDLSIVISVALYLLSALDAYVDAELYYFNISPQLTIDVGGMRDKSSGPSPQSVTLGASVRF